MSDVDLAVVMNPGDFLQRVGDQLVGSPVPPGMPPGGLVDQVLTKLSGTDYDTVWDDAAVDFADTPETIAGTLVDKAVTPKGLADTLAVFDVREYGAVGDGTTDDTPAFQAACNAAATKGGIVRVPVPATAYRLNSQVTIAGTRVAVVGDDPAGCTINYHGTSAVFDITSSGFCRLENMRLVNTGATGTHGVIVGVTTTTTGWKYELRRLDLFGFITNGLHVANSEQGIFEQIYVDGQGVTSVGILINAARHTGGTGIGMHNVFNRCRAFNCNSFGFDVNNQIGDRFAQCQALSNRGTYQFQVRGTTYGFAIEGLDVEDVVGAAASSGLYCSGFYHHIDVVAFSLNKGVEFAAATGCELRPSRMSSVTTPLLVGGTCVDLVIADIGNLGTMSASGSAEVTHFYGKKVRTDRVELTGTAGTTYLEFRGEQTADPAAPAANAARLFTKDNGAGKTALYARFNTGVIVLIATEP